MPRANFYSVLHKSTKNKKKKNQVSKPLTHNFHSKVEWFPLAISSIFPFSIFELNFFPLQPNFPNLNPSLKLLFQVVSLHSPTLSKPLTWKKNHNCIRKIRIFELYFFFTGKRFFDLFITMPLLIALIFFSVFLCNNWHYNKTFPSSNLLDILTHDRIIYQEICYKSQSDPIIGLIVILDIIKSNKK